MGERMIQFIKFMHYSGLPALIRVDHIIAVIPCEDDQLCDIHLSTGQAVSVRSTIGRVSDLLEGFVGQSWDGLPDDTGLLQPDTSKSDLP